MPPLDESHPAPLLEPRPASSDRAYRPTHAHEAPDSSMRTLALAAVGIALLVMGGVWFVSARAPHVVPVIEADTRPLRVKPVDRGGMQVVGADDPAMVAQDGAEKDDLTPPPEAPAPQALLRRTDAAPHPAPVSMPAAAPTPIPAAAGPITHPSPASRPAVAAASPPVAPSPVASAPHAGVQVQLAALTTQAAARAAWTQLTQRSPVLMDGHPPAITPVQRNGETLWRLRVGGFADIAAATAWCVRLRAKGGADCAIARF